IDMGNAMLGMAVADRLRKKMKMTRMTSTSARNKVNFTSSTDERMVSERSYKVSTFTEGGITALKLGSNCLIPSTTSTVLVPGWRWMASTLARRIPPLVPSYQLAVL